MTVAGQITDQDIDDALKAWRPVMGLSEGQYLPVVRYDKAADGSVTDILIPFGDTMREAMRAALESQHRRETEAGDVAFIPQADLDRLARTGLSDCRLYREPTGSRFVVPLYAASPSPPTSGVRVKADAITDEMVWAAHDKLWDKRTAGQFAAVLDALRSALGEHP